MALHIIRGTARGLKLDLPEQARPSSARLRESMISLILHNQTIAGNYQIGIDLFAGSGAVGLEMLSNIVEHVVFIENSRKNFHILEKNIAKFSQNTISKTEKIEAICGDVARAVPTLSCAPDLIFADPPYHYPIAHTIEICKQKGWLVAGKLLILQTAPKQQLPTPYQAVVTRRYGNACLHFLKS